MAKQKDGRYRAKVTVGHDADGVPIFKYVSGRTKKELEAEKYRLRQQYITGALDIKRDVLFRAYAKQWYTAVKEPHIGTSSRDNYRIIFEVHLFPVFGDRQLRAISALDLQEFLNSKIGYSKSFIDKLYTCIRQLFRYACAQGVITRDPATALHRPEAEEHHRRALTAEETAAALAVAQEHPRGLLLLILYYTGLRIGEALGLQWDDIDFTQHVLHVRRDIDQFGVGDVKTANSLRTVPIPDRLYSALAEALPSDAGSSFIFQGRNGSFWTKSAMRSAWSSMMGAVYEKDHSVEHKELRITRNTHGKGSILTPHYFRHNYASILYNAGVDVLTAQKWLGHSDPATTLRIYTHISQQKEQIDVEKVNSAFSQRV